jgi:hypothetical protein
VRIAVIPVGYAIAPESLVGNVIAGRAAIASSPVRSALPGQRALRRDGWMSG